MAFITEWLMPTGNFTLPLRSGYTYNMTVDWGDGSPTSEVTAYNDTDATHNYTVAGTYQISITGTCGAWYINNNAATKLKITKVIDWGNVGFTGLGLTQAFNGCANLTALPVGPITGAAAVTNTQGIFQNCTGLTSIPAGLFGSLGTLTSLNNSFYGCTGLTAIPDGLFNITAAASISLNDTFNGCINLTAIPSGFFDFLAGKISTFYQTFYGCTGLTALPVDLFRYNTKAGTMFQNTFFGCSGLTSLPADLFRYNTANTSFSNTFRNCTGLTALPVDLFRYNTAVTTFDNCFNNCTGLTALPVDLFRYNTAVTNFSASFYNNLTLATLPTDLFKYNTAATNFANCFQNCNALILNPFIFYGEGDQETRFLNKSINFTNCFNRTVYTGTEPGTAPDVWTCNYGTGTATTTNCFSGNGNSKTTILNYCIIPATWGAIYCTRLESIGSAFNTANTELISITTTTAILETETFNCYVSTILEGLEAPENLVAITKISDFLSQAITPDLPDNQTYYVLVKYADSVGANPETLDLTGLHFAIQPIPTTTINVTDPDNYITFNTPLQQHSFNHGSLFLNGYLYGSARNYFNLEWTSNCIFKLKADDYSIVQQAIYYTDQTAPNNNNNIIALIDQIVYCKGFIWGMGFNWGNSYLIRIDPGTLEQVIFITAAIGSKSQPIGTDGNYLFLSDDATVKKYDADLLLGTAASYGYTGAAPVALPENIVLASCDITILDATNPAFVHSFLSDNDFIYLAVTVCISKPTGWNTALSQYTTSFQKINKATMTTVASIGIPPCTDDMVQNSNYIFLCPEIQNTVDIFPGIDWGLIAINKTTLEIKYLKALAHEFNTANEADRAGFGVFLFDDKITVQLIASKKTVVVRLDDIESWGENFPIGGATDAIYKFQINGVDLAVPCNELVVDDQGWVHTNTWDIYTTVFKFPTGNIIPPVYNVLSLFNDSAAAVLSEINENYGCSIRCVQDAPGVADGVTGTATDQDGNTYNTVVINQKRWFVENLKTTHYRDGSPIANITANTPWSEDTDGAYCSFENI